MQHGETAGFIERTLSLTKPVIGLAFVQGQPEGVSRIGKAVPSTCAFWHEAETDVFYAAAADHLNCPLGAMVMGFPLPDETMGRLMEDVGMMCGTSYIREEEVEKVPKNGLASAGIVYGPLSRFPVEPDLALVWATPRQAMVVAESCGLMNWAAAPTGVYGRPGCAAVPIALTEGRPSQSFGCVGMRINTTVGDDLMLMAIPGGQLDSLVTELGRVSQVHGQLDSHYRERAAGVRSE